MSNNLERYTIPSLPIALEVHYEVAGKHKRSSNARRRTSSHTRTISCPVNVLLGRLREEWFALSQRGRSYYASSM
jgi:hypothetical protein